MLIAPIVNEFADYRARVSHDLCKQRFALQLSDVVSAHRVLHDARAWPLLRDETLRMLAMGPTLFGLVSPLFPVVTQRAQAYLARIEEASSAVEDGLEHGLVEVRSAANSLGQLLTQMGDQMREQSPGFSERAILDYFGGRDSKAFLSLFHDQFFEQVLPIVKGLLLGAKDNVEGYANFWREAVEAELRLRCVVVARAAEDVRTERVGSLARYRSILQCAQHVVSSWSPTVSPTDRAATVRESLATIGYGSKDELLSAFEGLRGNL